MDSVRQAILPAIILSIILMLLAFGWISRADVAWASTSPDCGISPLYPDSIQQWCSLIERYATQYNVDANLIAAVMLQESGGKAGAFSKSGAVGLMQVMPRDGKAAKFTCQNGPCFANRPTIDELLNPEFNIAYGTQLLSGLLYKYGNARDALKAYGPMNLGYAYADAVLRIYHHYR